jgi:hypothetical protein
MVGAEAAVLGRDHGARQCRGNPVERHHRALDALAGRPAPQHRGRDRIDEAIQRHDQVRQQYQDEHDQGDRPQPSKCPRHQQ